MDMSIGHMSKNFLTNMDYLQSLHGYVFTITSTFCDERIYSCMSLPLWLRSQTTAEIRLWMINYIRYL